MASETCAAAFDALAVPAWIGAEIDLAESTRLAVRVMAIWRLHGGTGAA